MSPFRIVMLLIAATLVSACAGPQTASRNATSTQERPSNVTASVDTQIFMPNAKIANIHVVVPRTLTVSEKNSYYPKGDIVWRGDLLGDRYEQVRAILQNSARTAASGLTGTRPVDLHIRVTRFHGLSDKARYTTGGVHNVNFVLTVVDPDTGTILRGPREVVTNLDALSGSAATAADARGETQKYRITTFLSHVLKTELTVPGGYVDTNSGFFVALNRSN